MIPSAKSLSSVSQSVTETFTVIRVGQVTATDSEIGQVHRDSSTGTVTTAVTRAGAQAVPQTSVHYAGAVTLTVVTVGGISGCCGPGGQS